MSACAPQLMASAGATQNASAPAVSCKTDKDCVSATSTPTTKCVIQADGYYSQVLTARSSFKEHRVSQRTPSSSALTPALFFCIAPQCIDCAETSYQSQCQSWSTAILLEAEVVCKVDSCPGKCPHETDAECQVPGHITESCVIEVGAGTGELCICTLMFRFLLRVLSSSIKINDFIMVELCPIQQFGMN
jgi:hypothetical protein